MATRSRQKVNCIGKKTVCDTTTASTSENAKDDKNDDTSDNDVMPLSWTSCSSSESVVSNCSKSTVIQARDPTKKLTRRNSMLHATVLKDDQKETVLKTPISNKKQRLTMSNSTSKISDFFQPSISCVSSNAMDISNVQKTDEPKKTPAKRRTLYTPAPMEISMKIISEIKTPVASTLQNKDDSKFVTPRPVTTGKKTQTKSPLLKSVLRRRTLFTPRPLDESIASTAIEKVTPIATVSESSTKDRRKTCFGNGIMKEISKTPENNVIKKTNTRRTLFTPNSFGLITTTSNNNGKLLFNVCCFFAALTFSHFL